jgi:hypothetical protein
MSCCICLFFCPPMVVLFGRQAKAGEAGFTIDHSLENTEPWNEQLCTCSDEEQGALSPTPKCWKSASLAGKRIRFGTNRVTISDPIGWNHRRVIQLPRDLHLVHTDIRPKLLSYCLDIRCVYLILSLFPTQHFIALRFGVSEGTFSLLVPFFFSSTPLTPPQTLVPNHLPPDTAPSTCLLQNSHMRFDHGSVRT